MIKNTNLVDYSLFETKIKPITINQSIFTYNLFINMFVVVFISILFYLLYLRYVNIQHIKDRNISDILFLHNYINGRITSTEYSD